MDRAEAFRLQIEAARLLAQVGECLELEASVADDADLKARLLCHVETTHEQQRCLMLAITDAFLPRQTALTVAGAGWPRSRVKSSSSTSSWRLRPGPSSPTESNCVKPCG